MSGGSYNYLCYKDATQLLSAESDSDIQGMSDRLAGLGYASDAAMETEQLLLTIRQSRNRIDAIVKRLSPVWRAIEWWDSGDSGEDNVKDSLENYRGNQAE